MACTQIPISDPVANPGHLKLVEEWLRSYKPEELFDESGALIPELKAMAPEGRARITANPHANGGLLRKPLLLPDFRDYAVKVAKPGRLETSSTANLAKYLADVMRKNMTDFRVFGPDETASNKLDGIYAASPKAWMEELKPEDADGGFLSRSGRVMERLSEHTLEGWRGYLLTGRHGFFSSYEAFVHIIDSMFNSMRSGWRSRSWSCGGGAISSLNLLITSLVWRQDQRIHASGPGISGCGDEQSLEVVRIYLPPDANCLLSVANALPVLNQLRECDCGG